jgi:hypothetical protein
VIGIEVTIYDPELDPKGEYLSAIVDFLASGLAEGFGFGAPC